MTRFLPWALAALLALTLPLAAQAPRSSADYLAAGDFDGARAALARLTQGRPDADLYRAHLEGLILLRQGQPEAAAEVFRAILTARPDHVPARRGLTEALARMGDLAGAGWHAERLLSAATDPRERAGLDALVAQARAGRPRGVALRFAVQPSTNGTRGPDLDVVVVDGVPFVLDPRSRSAGGTDVTLGLGAWTTWALSPDWNAVLSLGIDHRLAASPRPDETSVDLRFEAVRQGPGWHLAFGPRADLRLQDGDEKRQRLGFGLSGGRRLESGALLSGSLVRWRQRHADAAFQDGHLTEAVLGWRRPLSATTAVWVTVPLRHETTGRAHLDNRSAGIEFGAEREWTGGLITSGALSYTRSEYGGPYPGFGVVRQDDVVALRTGLRHRTLRLGRFLPELTVTATRARSTVPLHRWDGVDLGLALSTQF